MNRFFPNYPRYIITSPFGMRTLRGKTKMHRGIDLVATTDGKVGRVDTVMAHSGGKVIAVGYNETSGNYLKIQTAPGVVMLYCHFAQPPVVAKGETVTQGQKLGYMGATGNATGAHLHFGLQVDGEYIDPQPYLDTDFTRQPEPNPEPNPEPKNTVTVTLPVLKRGDKGDQIKPVQRMLHCLGYDLGDKPIDGSFGPATEKAVQEYQARYGLEPDGVVGEKTWKKLLSINT